MFVRDILLLCQKFHRELSRREATKKLGKSDKSSAGSSGKPVGSWSNKAFSTSSCTGPKPVPTLGARSPATAEASTVVFSADSEEEEEAIRPRSICHPAPAPMADLSDSGSDLPPPWAAAPPRRGGFPSPPLAAASRAAAADVGPHDGLWGYQCGPADSGAQWVENSALSTAPPRWLGGRPLQGDADADADSLTWSSDGGRCPHRRRAVSFLGPRRRASVLSSGRLRPR